jgi:3-dehydroquinate dehydratase-1
MGKDKQEVLTEAKRVIAQGAQMIEWRIDYLETALEPPVIEDVLKELAALCERCILLVTIRTKRQGGLAEVKEPRLSELYRAIAAMGYADLLDVEFFEVESPGRLLRQLQGEGAKVITSHHDFETTPKESVMLMLFEQMAQGGADIVKLAVMPRELQDVLRLLQVTCDFAEENPDIPVVSMSMGSMGIISRVCGEVFGSCMTFGTMGHSSAPGQMKETELHQVLDIIHENFER